MWRVNLEVYRLAVDTLVVTSDPGCLVLDFTLDVGEIGEPPVGNMVKLGPFRTAGCAG